MSEFDELGWWGTCENTFHEEQKQFAYAKRMGLVANWGGAHPPTYDIAEHSVIDLGGGPISLLLKCANRGYCVIADPADYPEWVLRRYLACKIDYWKQTAETVAGGHFDEAWIYNVLQHVEDPERVIAVAREVAQTLRVFEWIEIDPYPGHPHRLDAEQLDEWIGSKGFAAAVDENGAVGRAYYGVFLSDPTKPTMT